MPTSEAVEYIVKNYSRQVGKPLGSVVSQRPVFEVPSNVKNILNDFCDDNPLGISEYDTLLKFLMDQRETHQRANYGLMLPTNLFLPSGLQEELEPALRGKREEIQAHVLEILNRDPDILTRTPPDWKLFQERMGNSNNSNAQGYDDSGKNYGAERLNSQASRESNQSYGYSTGRTSNEESGMSMNNQHYYNNSQDQRKQGSMNFDPQKAQNFFSGMNSMLYDMMSQMMNSSQNNT
eukprot:TRINITY_DN37704_c0_g1_i1.p1 TRINITY_DN37704_c0_g1~~TRINITY_DN37704_c0_g1_i1.p1  ORF type:complete len:236 (-),score=45.74 TRINITY_DN37704_c0_g1_i1:181-888(-)